MPQRQTIAGRDQSKYHPPWPLVESFDAHRQTEHRRVSQQDSECDGPLCFRRKLISLPGFHEKPAKKPGQGNQTEDPKIGEKPHRGVMRDLALPDPEAAEPAAK